MTRAEVLTRDSDIKASAQGRLSRTVPLLVILSIAAVLRLALLWRDAPPLFADEIEQYVSMHSIASIGADIDGKLQPFLACRLGRNPPIYGIAAYVSTLALGNSPFGWRFPAVVFGLVAIALVFLIVRELTRRDAIALGAALLFAIEPNQIHFSRIGWEPATVLPFLLCVIWIILIALRDPGRPLSFRVLVAGAIVLGLTPYTYPLTWIYAVVLVGALLALTPAVFRDVSNRRKLCAAATIAAAIAFPGLWITLTDPHTLDRSARVLTFAHGVTGRSLATFVHNYVSHFSWPYLFATGSPDPRYLSGYGALYWWYGPLIVSGAVYARRYFQSRALYWWLWVWAAIYPLGGALTNDGVVPHATRTLAGTPVFSIFAAIGAYALLTEIARFVPTGPTRRRFRACVLAVLLACVVGSTWSFSWYYFNVYPVVSSRAWESGTREAFAAVRMRESGYRRLCVVGFDYWHVETLERYFLANTPLTLIEGLKRPECRGPGTLLLSTSVKNIQGFYVVDVAKGLDGDVFAVLEAREGEQPKGVSSFAPTKRTFVVPRATGPV